MTSRLGLLRIVPLALAVLAWCAAGPAAAAPITYHVDVNTSPPGVPAGTKGSLEFQFASLAGNPPGSATIFSFTSDGSLVGSPTPFLSDPTNPNSPTLGTVFGSLAPRDSLEIAETPAFSADAFQNFNFGSSLHFDVTLPDPGTFSLFLWDQPGGQGNLLLSASDVSANGAALVLFSDGSGTQGPGLEPITGPGVRATVAPEPSSLALFAVAAAGLLARRWRRRPA
jgi:hypothetical protein